MINMLKILVEKLEKHNNQADDFDKGMKTYKKWSNGNAMIFKFLKTEKIWHES